MGRDSGGAVCSYTKKKILSSSGERRIRRAKHSIVLDVFLTRGPTWKHIREMRERWGIEAQSQMPPPYQGFEYVPESLQSRPEEEFGEEAERWHATFDEWRNDLAALYEAVIPDEARGSGYMTFGWSVFLSMCVLFDPPETQLAEFAERFGWAGSNVIPRGGRTMNAPPIVWRKEHNELEATWMEFYEGLLGALLEKYVHPQGVTTEEAIRAIRGENPEIFKRWRERLHRNESRPFIDVQPYHKSEDVDAARQVLRDRYENSASCWKGQTGRAHCRSMRHSLRSPQSPGPHGPKAAEVGVRTAGRTLRRSRVCASRQRSRSIWQEPAQPI